MASVIKNFSTTCYGDLRDAINDDSNITSNCEQIVATGSTTRFVFDSPLSDDEDTALDGLLSSWVCPAPSVDEVDVSEISGFNVDSASDGDQLTFSNGEWAATTVVEQKPYVGFINLTTSTGDINITGVGFEPVYIAFYMNSDIESENWNEASPTNTSTEENNYGFGVGFAVNVDAGTLQQAQYMSASSSSINAHRTASTNADCLRIVTCNQNGNQLGELLATVTSFDSDGFTLNISSNSLANGYVIQYVALPPYRGPSGLKGEKGNPGGGSNVSITNNGALVGVADTVNYVGYNITDDGSGIVSINSPIYGSQFQQVASEVISTTTGTPFVQKLRMSTSILPQGIYRIGFYSELKSNSGNGSADARVQLNDTTTIAEIFQEPDDAANWFPFGGFVYQELSGVNTIDIDFKRSQSNTTVSIRRSRIEVWRVS